jgi:hypothetical protein
MWKVSAAVQESENEADVATPVKLLRPGIQFTILGRSQYFGEINV